MGMELERFYLILFSSNNILFSLALILWNGAESNQIEYLIERFISLRLLP